MFGQLLDKLAPKWEWAKANWQVLVFWLFCLLAGWWLGSQGYGTAIFFRLAGASPELWDPYLQVTARKDPKVSSVVSLMGLTDLNGNPVRLPFRDKVTGLLFVCGRCGLDEVLELAQTFQARNAQKIRLCIVYIGEFDAEFYRILSTFKVLVFLEDPQLKVLRSLNALYMPRFYLISPDGTLKYLGPLSGHYWNSEQWQKEFERIEKLLGG